MEEAFKFLAEAGVYFLATVDAEGKPQNRPFGSKALIDGKFLISTNYPKAVYKQLIEQKFVDISAMAHEGRGWIRIKATAVPEEDIELKKKILEGRPGPAPDPSEVALFSLRDATAVIYGEGEPETHTW
jgi:uncharacterized pyridoxamine 5'-phosphate oxidase family protein